jgi:predicted CoA-substrate-specific enzyme activase
MCRDRQVLKTGYAIHQGNAAKGLSQALQGFELPNVTAVTATTSTPEVVQAVRRYDNKLALIRAAQQHAAGFGSILLIGGEKFGLLSFDEEGRYQSFRTNTSCAAGTGSFLDQQAARLQLSGPAELSRLAETNQSVTPKIASRCAVFAKTDLIHAQQEGFSLAAICDGLCQCLAKNVVDTLFGSERVVEPILLCGGVARNHAVVAHLRDLLKAEIVVDSRCHLLAAIGGALSWLDKPHDQPRLGIETASDLVAEVSSQRYFSHPPLQLEHSFYPDLENHRRYTSHTSCVAWQAAVEVDAYRQPVGPTGVTVGIDIGSTSTKAVLIDDSREVLAGFYTRTSGNPLGATQALLETIDSWAREGGVTPQVVAVGTTGSGRKLIGRIIGADLVVDEISAHARAAFELDPSVDTIIEIGGQDSKFTTLHDGRVTSAIMNNVCAAGTGSFIEEQARRLDCPLEELSVRTEGVAAPPASDRCTVFMERDLNHLLTEGYRTEEVLAAVVHSVRENYLVRVAVEREIGNSVHFQGATAKIRSLVAAFEQRLGKPLQVSRYCHLTGALGVALTLADEGVTDSRFRGLGLYRQSIPLRFETCELCVNSCKITVADLPEGAEAYGFLCGRDYSTGHYVELNRSGFDLFKERRKAFSFTPAKRDPELPTIGIPAALHLVEDLPFWHCFFSSLGFATVTSSSCSGAVSEGKNLSGAEFCAPVSALFGHVHHLLQRADYVFVPFYFEDAERAGHGIYCYYTQFTPSLVSMLGEAERRRVLTPAVRCRYPDFHAVLQLHRALAQVTRGAVSILQVAAAYDRAKKLRTAASQQLQSRFRAELESADDIAVVLLGRPYTVLSPSLNHGVPGLLAAQGVKTFSQEMLTYTADEVKEIEPLLDEIHWRFASKILEVTEVIARTDGVYPVLITAFHCSPDSFAVHYFRSLLHAHGKPYLIIELDEHDSPVGYETRIEAAVHAFRNHRRLQRQPRPALTSAFNPGLQGKINGRKVILPSWDPLACRLLVANLHREGIDAELMQETEGSIQRSLSHNTGQCLPVNAIAQGFIEHLTAHRLEPTATLLWMIRSDFSCNLRLYAHHIKTLLDAHGKGIEQAGVYIGKISFSDISPRASFNAYFAFLLGGYLRRMACRVRPYEPVVGLTDQATRQGLAICEAALLGQRPREEAVAEVVGLYASIPQRPVSRRPQVAIFGDLYARDNDVLNQGLERFIEEHGGEVISTPYTDHAKMVAGAYFKTWFSEGKLGRLLWNKTILTTMATLERPFYRQFERVLGDEIMTRFDDPPERILADYNLRTEHAGESVENLLWAHYTSRHFPNLVLFVQASPAFCCPALVTEAMRKRIEQHTGIPVVSITYDGTGGSKNEAIIPYLQLN